MVWPYPLYQQHLNLSEALMWLDFGFDFIFSGYIAFEKYQLLLKNLVSVASCPNLRVILTPDYHDCGYEHSRTPCGCNYYVCFDMFVLHVSFVNILWTLIRIRRGGEGGGGGEGRAWNARFSVIFLDRSNSPGSWFFISPLVLFKLWKMTHFC